MATIADPWNSRPIDVHRWSDHPEIVGLVEQVCLGVDAQKPQTIINEAILLKLMA